MVTSFGKLFNKDDTAKKLQQEIEAIELKKQSILSGLQLEVQQLQQKIDQTLFQIGSETYNHYMDHAEIGDCLRPYYEEIASLKNAIQEKKAKTQEFAVRYDEEIGMLRMNLTPASVPAPTPSFSGTDSAFCENCGTPFIPGQDAFCEKCGKKLS